MTAYDILKANPVIPVVKITSSSSSASLCRALLAGGISCVEITLRTDAALDAIKAAKAAFPDMTVAAGTVINKALASAAVSAGADMIVSPGFDAETADFCRARGIPYIPGVADATEIQAAIKAGLKVLKFFPAEAAGGVSALKALSAPFSDVLFMPTGGIDEKNISSYQALKCVLCCGASAVAPSHLIDSGSFDEITARAKSYLGSNVAEKAAPSALRCGRVVCLGEIMLRLSPPEKQRFVQADCFEAVYGGAEANVAVSLSCMGQRVSYVTALPDNDMGQAALNVLRRYGVDTSYIVRGGDRLGVYYLEKGADIRPSKVIYDRKGSAMACADDSDFNTDAILKGAAWFHITGITPAISDNARVLCMKAVKCAKSHGAVVSLDLNYREKLWGVQEASSVVKGLLPFVDVFIGNEEHVFSLLGIRGNTLRDTCRNLCDKYGFTCAAITRRRTVSADVNRICAAVCLNGACVNSDELEVSIVDRVGGGDAFAAGLIYSLMTGKSAADCAGFSLAASALKHSIPGDFSTATVAEIEKAAKGSGAVMKR